jgi:transcriptional regulator with AAA-type ATPase domain
MSTTTLANWLESATELGMLPREVLESIASELKVLVVPAGCRVTIEDTPVTKLYILESGQAERYRRQRAGLMWATGLLPGAVVNLSVLISGEPGLEKDNIAALIHFGSKRRHQPIISLKSALITANGAELFGRVGGKPGLLEWLGEGTLILNDVQELPRELVPQIDRLLTTGNYTPFAREGQTPLPPRPSNARIITSSRQ